MSSWWAKSSEGEPQTPDGSESSATPPPIVSESAVKRISLDAASKEELSAFVKQQAAHIKTLESKCVTLIEHYKKVQGERKELLDKYNHASQAAEEAQVRLETLPDLQNLCRSLEEKARTLEEERNAIALDGEAKQQLLAKLQANTDSPASNLVDSEAMQDLERQVSDAIKAKEEAEESLALIKAELNNSLLERDEMKGRVAELDQAQAMARELSAELVASKAGAAERDQALQKKIASVTKELTEARKLFEKANTEVATMHSKLEKSQIEASLAQSSMASSTEHNSKLQKQVSQLKGEVTQLKADVENSHGSATEQNSSLQKDVAALRGQLSEAKEMKSELSDLKEELQRTQEEKAALAAQLETSSAATESALEGKAAIEKEKAAIEKEKMAVDGELNELRSTSGASEELVATLKRDLEATKSEHESAVAELTMAHNAKESNSEMVERFRSENAKLLADLKAVKESKSALIVDHKQQLEASQESSQGEIEMLRKERSTYAELMASRDAKLAELQKEISGLQQQGTASVTQLQEELVAIKQERQEESNFAAERNQDMTAKNTRLREELAEAQTQRIRETEEWAGRLERLEKLEAQVTQLQGDKKSLEGERDTLSTERGSLEATVKELTATVERLKEEVAVKTTAPPASVTQDQGPSIMEEELRKMKMLLRLAKQHLEDYRDKHSAVSEELRKETNQRQKVELEAVSRQSQMEELGEELDKIKAELETSKDSMSVVKAKCLQLQTRQADDAAKYSALREKAALLGSNAEATAGSATSAAGAVAREEIRHLKQEILDLRQAVQELNAENVRLASEHQSVESAQSELALARRERDNLRGRLEELTLQLRNIEATQTTAVQSVRSQMQSDLDAKTAELVQLEQETGAKFDELSAQLRLYRQRTKKALEQKDLSILQLKKRLKEGPGESVAEPVAPPVSAPSVDSSEKPPVDASVGLHESELKDKVAQLTGVVRDNAKLLQVYQGELEKAKKQAIAGAGDGPDLEYLKNILLRYFETPSPENQKRLLPVMKMILDLSPHELTIIEKSQRKGGILGFF